MKPQAGSGSAGVRLVENRDDLLDHYERLTASVTNERGQPQSSTVLVEELLEGPEFSVESMTRGRGRTHIVGITRKYLSSPPWFVELGHDYPATVTDGQRRGMEDCVTQGLEAVGYDFGPAHTELRWTSRGPVIIEINPRLAGGMIPELVRLASGIDLIDAYIRMIVGEPFHLDPVRQQQASIRFITAPHAGILSTVPDCADLRSAPGVAGIEVTACAGRRVQPPRSSDDRLGFVICDSPERAEAIHAQVLSRLTIDTTSAP